MESSILFLSVLALEDAVREVMPCCRRLLSSNHCMHSRDDKEVFDLISSYENLLYHADSGSNFHALSASDLYTCRPGLGDPMDPQDEEEEERQPTLQGWNQKVDKKRLGYGPADPLNRMVTHIDGMTMDRALAWMKVIDGCSPSLKAEILFCWSAVKVDVGLVQNSCYVACLPIQFDAYCNFFQFLQNEAAASEGMSEISSETVSEQWLREKVDVFMWH